MIEWFESLGTVESGIVVVGGFVASTMLMGYVVSRFTSHQVRTDHNDRAGFILAVIGVVYAVLLAFIAIGVWERFQQAEMRSYEEAGAIATIYRDASSFPGAASLRALLRKYVESVIDDEWPRMGRGVKSEIISPLALHVDLRVRALPVPSRGLEDVHQEMLQAMSATMVDRRTRLTSDYIGISGLMWVVLVAGAYVTVGFTYLFGFERTIMQQLMIFGLSLMIGLVLFLVLAMDLPYRGGIAVGPDAFSSLLESWRNLR